MGMGPCGPDIGMSPGMGAAPGCIGIGIGMPPCGASAAPFLTGTLETAALPWACAPGFAPASGGPDAAIPP